MTECGKGSNKPLFHHFLKMLSLVNYIDYDLSPKYAIIHELTK